MYRTYLRSTDQSVSDKTSTGDRDAALAAFAALTERADLDGSKMLAVLNQDGKPLAHHRFDRAPGDPDYWRGRLHELGPKAPVGAPRQLEGGRRVNLFLDDATIAEALRLNPDNVSEGIRMGMRRSAAAATGTPR